MPRPASRAPILRSPAIQPFGSAEDAWIWTAQALLARRDGARLSAAQGGIPRPCEPDDVVRCLDQLYRQRRIVLDHAEVLRRYGDRARAPDRTLPGERADARLWDEALDRLAAPLRQKGIVTPALRAVS